MPSSVEGGYAKHIRKIQESFINDEADSNDESDESNAKRRLFNNIANLNIAYMVGYLSAVSEKHGWDLDTQQLAKSLYSGSEKKKVPRIGNQGPVREVYPNIGRYITNTVKTIKQIEQEVPGGAAKLQKEFGLNQFARYPVEALIEQAAGPLRPDNYGLCIYCESDYSESFQGDGEMLQTLWNQLRDGGVDMYFAECNSALSLVRRLLDSQSEVKGKLPLQFLIIGAHGTEQSLTFGESENGHLSLEELNTSGADRLSGLIGQRASTVFLSCDVGVEGGFAQKASEVLSNETVAPNNRLHQGEVTVRSINPDGVELDLIHKEGHVRRYIDGLRVENW